MDKDDFDLSNLHDLFKNNKLLKKTDQATLFHKAIYSTFDDPKYFTSHFGLVIVIFANIVEKKTGFSGEWAIQRFQL